jgi:hypothetical protein
MDKALGGETNHAKVPSKGRVHHIQRGLGFDDQVGADNAWREQVSFFLAFFAFS